MIYLFNMAILTTLPTLTCPHSTPHTATEEKNTPILPLTPKTTDEPAHVVSSPTCSEAKACAMSRRNSEAEIEARLARIPGHVCHAAEACAVDPERLARLRKAQGEAMEELRTSLVFRPSSDMAAAVAAIERRKMWEGLRGWE